jgi:hypothetical protein
LNKSSMKSSKIARVVQQIYSNSFHVVQANIFESRHEFYQLLLSSFIIV